jgi:hypothetical protein
LREELLRRVVKGEEKSVEKILKRIEHRLKAQDSLAKQEIMHGRTEKIAESEWWVDLIAAPLSYFVHTLIITGVFLFATYKGFEGFARIPKITLFLLGISWLLLIVIIIYAFIQAYFLLKGKKEYERRKKEEEELEK